ncbi:MAG: hypothetical protein K1X67_07825 [Fimbriimonadaceae bacterium]|nr:hypothetical protein [Fimbriimonadaceae bacterium]
MSTKSHWRQAGLLSGLVATLGPVPASLMSVASPRYGFSGALSKKRTPKRFLDHATDAMLRRGWKPNAKFNREKVR